MYILISNMSLRSETSICESSCFIYSFSLFSIMNAIIYITIVLFLHFKEVLLNLPIQLCLVLFCFVFFPTFPANKQIIRIKMTWTISHVPSWLYHFPRILALYNAV